MLGTARTILNQTIGWSESRTPDVLKLRKTRKKSTQKLDAEIKTAIIEQPDERIKKKPKTRQNSGIIHSVSSRRPPESVLRCQ